MTRGISRCGHSTAYLAEAWQRDRGMLHVIAYSDPAAQKRDVPGVLDDYAFRTRLPGRIRGDRGDLSYFNFARKIGDTIDREVLSTKPRADAFFDTKKIRWGRRSTLGCASGEP